MTVSGLVVELGLRPAIARVRLRTHTLTTVFLRPPCDISGDRTLDRLQDALDLSTRGALWILH